MSTISKYIKSFMIVISNDKDKDNHKRLIDYIRIDNFIYDIIDNKIDILITIGNEAKYIDEMAKPKKKLHFDNNEDAEKELKKIMQSNDAVLLKASNGMKFFEIANIIKEF